MKSLESMSESVAALHYCVVIDNAVIEVRQPMRADELEDRLVGYELCMEEGIVPDCSIFPYDVVYQGSCVYIMINREGKTIAVHTNIQATILEGMI